jgi:hypothetical protein
MPTQHPQGVGAVSSRNVIELVPPTPLLLAESGAVTPAIAVAVVAAMTSGLVHAAATAVVPVTTAVVPVTTAVVPAATAVVPAATAVVPAATAVVPVTTALVSAATAVVPVTTALVSAATTVVLVAKAMLPVATAAVPSALAKVSPLSLPPPQAETKKQIMRVARLVRLEWMWPSRIMIAVPKTWTVPSDEHFGSH